ncbi:MAG TPA: NADH-quinone oxidoreductase subunit C [Candidatus Dormibacteraeota bacterium]|jgi:NADH:ubiquinone oxidoreductase subunit C|nr:NADH-quinone oxidoreductase subunit C [Candidatus Dormibacteraeota bacterium]
MTPQAVATALRRLGMPAEVESAPQRGRLHRDADTDDAGAEAPATAPVGVRCEVPPAQLLTALRAARDELGFDLLSSITATDEGDHFALLYHLVRVADLEFNGFLLLVSRALKDKHPDGPVVPSAVPVYSGANLQEREIFDLMGVRFRGHPKLTRVLTWTGFSGHPLRKDYEPVDEEIPWRLAGLRGPDGTLLSEEDARRAEEERDAWELVDSDASVAAAPHQQGGGGEEER